MIKGPLHTNDALVDLRHAELRPHHPGRDRGQRPHPGWYPDLRSCSNRLQLHRQPDLQRHLCDHAPMLIAARIERRNWRPSPNRLQVHGPGADLPQRQHDDGRQRRHLHRRPLLGPDPRQRRRLRAKRDHLRDPTRLSPPPTPPPPAAGTPTSTAPTRAADDRGRERHHHRRRPLPHSCTIAQRQRCSGLIANNFVRVYHALRADRTTAILNVEARQRTRSPT